MGSFHGNLYQYHKKTAKKGIQFIEIIQLIPIAFTHFQPSITHPPPSLLVYSHYITQ